MKYLRGGAVGHSGEARNSTEEDRSGTVAWRGEELRKTDRAAGQHVEIPLSKSSELKAYLGSMYVSAAQYNHPPDYPVTIVCGGIDGAPYNASILQKIFAGLVAYGGISSCYFNEPRSISETTVGWNWQDIKLILHRFGSNIIFSNGLRDPYSIGGVLDNISDAIVAVHTVNGSHCLDILFAKDTDPEWLVMQRKVEVRIINDGSLSTMLIFSPTRNELKSQQR
ncbi:hypothetical protein CMV_017070 [Castanea mollissima]|uniref:Uncharacterized protein n=1 Tax=Castanea mollissima TaxID=60419 RepID=A0A8J4R2T6_9ROSI|nr:hypothetical protein CMV_017070 [Castanea mollissima]